MTLKGNITVINHGFLKLKVNYIRSTLIPFDKNDNDFKHCCKNMSGVAKADYYHHHRKTYDCVGLQVNHNKWCVTDVRTAYQTGL